MPNRQKVKEKYSIDFQTWEELRNVRSTVSDRQDMFYTKCLFIKKVYRRTDFKTDIRKKNISWKSQIDGQTKERQHKENIVRQTKISIFESRCLERFWIKKRKNIYFILANMKMKNYVSLKPIIGNFWKIKEDFYFQQINNLHCWFQEYTYACPKTALKPYLRRAMCPCISGYPSEF